MRIGSIIFWVGFALFLALPVIGYQHYLKGLRKQTDAIGMGKDQLKDTIQNDLSKLTRQLDPNAAKQGASDAGGAAAKSKKLFEAMEKTQKQQQKNNPLLKK